MTLIISLSPSKNAPVVNVRVVGRSLRSRRPVHKTQREKKAERVIATMTPPTIKEEEEEERKRNKYKKKKKKKEEMVQRSDIVGVAETFQSNETYQPRAGGR